MGKDAIDWEDSRGVDEGTFEDVTGTTYRIAESVRLGDEDCISLGRVPSPAILTRKHVRMLLPHLLAFASGGKLRDGSAVTLVDKLLGAVEVDALLVAPAEEK